MFLKWHCHTTYNFVVWIPWYNNYSREFEHSKSCFNWLLGLFFATDNATDEYGFLCKKCASSKLRSSIYFLLLTLLSRGKKTQFLSASKPWFAKTYIVSWVPIYYSYQDMNTSKQKKISWKLSCCHDLVSMVTSLEKSNEQNCEAFPSLILVSL